MRGFSLRGWQTECLQTDSSPFVLIAVLCYWDSGEPVAAGDALDAAFVTMVALGSSDLVLSLDVEDIVWEAYELVLVSGQKRSISKSS